VIIQVLAIALVWCCMQTCTGWEQLGIVQTRLQNLVRQQNRFVYNQCFARSVSDYRRLTLMAIYLLIPKQIQGKGKSNQIPHKQYTRTGNVNVYIIRSGRFHLLVPCTVQCMAAILLTHAR
jgi:hypothetical protein